MSYDASVQYHLKGMKREVHVKHGGKSGKRDCFRERVGKQYIVWKTLGEFASYR